MQDVMLDIETLGTGPNAAILSIGAVAFDLRGPNPHLYDPLDEMPYTFHQRVHLDTSDPAKRGDIDPATVEWWLQQDAEARAAVVSGQRAELGSVLQDFAGWLRAHEPKRLWSNGPTFDETIVRNAFSRYGMRFPVSFRASRCCRTLLDLAAASGFDYVRHGQVAAGLPKHDALADAVWQARNAIAQASYLAPE